MAGRETDAGPPDAGLPGQLARFVRAQLPDADSLKILGLQRRGGGLSRENWAFDLTVRDGGRAQAIPMMLRRDPVAGLLATDRRVEFGALQALASTPVPAPVAYWLDEDGTWLGFPSLIMSREEGQPDWLALNGDRPENDRLQLARELLDHLIGLQAVDWRATVLAKLLDDPGPDAALAAVRFWHGELLRHQLEPLPEMTAVRQWLLRHAPQSADTVIVHGDYKPGNVLLVGNEIRAVLDWETVHLGSALEDLGWITNPVRAREHQIPGRWERAQIVEHYAAATGRRVTQRELLWWNVFSCWKLSVIVISGLSAFVAGQFDRVHLLPTWLFKNMFKLIENAG
ncbi:MAG TPA: phosphotransferase family protein [Streptosporangiaceae bacterium]|jgi:aminoglycoside phosphotransferase (APT) family kinase protein